MQATVVAGSLPAGLSIAARNGDTGTVTIAGIPTAHGAAVVQVTATDGVGATIRRNYVVTIAAGGGLVDAPKVTSISPAAGVTAGGTVVTITGTNLIGAVAVFFGDQLARITSATNTTWVVVSPPGTVGTVGVSVVTGIGTAAAGQFQYVKPPTFSPAVLPVGAVGVAYNKSISVNGGTDTWVLSYVVVGQVPKGLKISQSSPGGPITISGKPAAAGSFKIKVTAKSTLGVNISQSYLATIN